MGDGAGPECRSEERVLGVGRNQMNEARKQDREWQRLSPAARREIAHRERRPEPSGRAALLRPPLRQAHPVKHRSKTRKNPLSQVTVWRSQVRPRTLKDIHRHLKGEPRGGGVRRAWPPRLVRRHARKREDTTRRGRTIGTDSGPAQTLDSADADMRGAVVMILCVSKSGGDPGTANSQGQTLPRGRKAPAAGRRVSRRRGEA